jgi:hypothetical protein
MKWYELNKPQLLEADATVQAVNHVSEQTLEESGAQLRYSFRDRSSI